ncbi:hypothetical protein JCM1840_007412 [Sporobolomyces johnsonii]
MLLVPPILLFALLPAAVQALQIPFYARPVAGPPASSSPPPPSNERTFTLRHALHASTTHRHLPPSKLDYSQDDLVSLSAVTSYSTSQSLRTRKLRIHRPSSQAAFQAARRASFFTPLRALQAGRLPSLEELEDHELASTLEWDEVEIEAPDTDDPETLAAIGKMTSNAYTTPDGGGWYDIGGGWNKTDSFGWKEHGIRGHVFADEKNETVVISIKGTSAFIVGGGTETSKNDKINDNLLFSCCCARVDWSWSTVCDCYDSPYTCRQDCVEEAVMTKSAYYPVATDLYNNVSALYPHAQIWLSGHSLGGGIAAMLSRTYAVPSVSFESPGDLLATRRLHLPLPPPLKPNASHPPDAPPRRSLQDELTTHVFHTADPIPMGVCTGTISSCAIAGFALESRCHTGKTILYDTVGRLGWSVDVRTHPIKVVIDYLLREDWGKGKKELGGEEEEEEKRGAWGWWPGRGKKGDGDEEEGGGGDEDDGQRGGKGVPKPRWEEDDCVDCYRWDYIDG